MTTTFIIEQVDPAALAPDPLHARRMTDAQLASLARSIRAHGMPAPIIAMRRGAQIIDGHQRQRVARQLGLATVPVVYVDLEVAPARLLGLGLNQISGDWDAGLATLLAQLRDESGLDLSLAGFDDAELRRLLRSFDQTERRQHPEDFDLEDALASATREPLTRPGMVWRLGAHLVGCGDATSPADVGRLLEIAGARPDMAFTDPPYGVALGDHGGRQPGSRRRRVANDALPEADFDALLTASMPILLGSVDGALYVCMSSKELPRLSRILETAGGHWSDTIIWRKDRHVLGRADYQRAYEPIWYGWREGATRHWAGGRRQSDVWDIERPVASPLHPTMKPLELVERAIANSCPHPRPVPGFGHHGHRRRAHRPDRPRARARPGARRRRGPPLGALLGRDGGPRRCVSRRRPVPAVAPGRRPAGRVARHRWSDAPSASCMTRSMPMRPPPLGSWGAIAAAGPASSPTASTCPTCAPSMASIASSASPSRTHWSSTTASPGPGP